MSQHWILRDDSAQFSGNAWNLNVALGGDGPQLHLRSRNKPELGTDVVVIPIQNGNASAIAPLPLSDAYIRGEDLVACYAETPAWRFGYQMDIRFMDPSEPNASRFEVWLSVQTSLLDAYPQMMVRFQKPRYEERDSGVWTSIDHRIGIILHPLDRHDSSAKENSSNLELNAFGQFLEKGVIRRMRFRLLADTHSRSDDDWKKELEKFSESPLPLTA